MQPEPNSELQDIVQQEIDKMRIYYFDGDGGCDHCQSNTGFSINEMPQRPHPYCDCPIEVYEDRTEVEVPDQGEPGVIPIPMDENGWPPELDPGTDEGIVGNDPNGVICVLPTFYPTTTISDPMQPQQDPCENCRIVIENIKWRTVGTPTVINPHGPGRQVWCTNPHSFPIAVFLQQNIREQWDTGLKAAAQSAGWSPLPVQYQMRTVEVSGMRVTHWDEKYTDSIQEIIGVKIRRCERCPDQTLGNAVGIYQKYIDFDVMNITESPCPRRP